VIPLLTTLQRSRLATLYAEVSGLLVAQDGEEMPGERDPFSSRRWEDRDEQAMAQLKLIDGIVMRRIKLELELTERSRKLANEIDAGLGDRRAERFATVVVTKAADSTEASEATSRDVDLLSGVRFEAISRLLDGWMLAVEKIRGLIVEEGDLQ